MLNGTWLQICQNKICQSPLKFSNLPNFSPSTIHYTVCKIAIFGNNTRGPGLLFMITGQSFCAFLYGKNCLRLFALHKSINMYKNCSVTIFCKNHKHGLSIGLMIGNSFMASLLT